MNTIQNNIQDKQSGIVLGIHNNIQESELFHMNTGQEYMLNNSVDNM